LDEYVKAQKKSAPNSWQNNEFYLKHYVLYWFLQVKRLNNIELWSDHFDGFMTYLETAKKIKSNGPIAVSSRNHAIKALNTFLEHLYKKKIVTQLIKCETFPLHLVNERTIDDVVHPNEVEKVCKRLETNGHKLESVYFRYLYFSGMRFNEGLCISLGDLFQDEIQSDFMKKKLKAYKQSRLFFLPDHFSCCSWPSSTS
jgi:hypothetical protein